MLAPSQTTLADPQPGGYRELLRLALPLIISNANNVMSVDFFLNYNSTLLNIANFTLNTTLSAAGVSAGINNSVAGVIQVDIFGGNPFTTTDGAVILGYFTANVPGNAPYASKEILSFTDLVIADSNGTTMPSVGDDAIHVSALGRW